MIAKIDNASAPATLTPKQIEILQQQIRQFKNLSKRYSDSNLSKYAETYAQTQSQTVSKLTNKEVSKELVKESETRSLPQPSLSWQCFNSLLFCGPNRFPQDGAISFTSSDFGCFLKSAHLPLVVTIPYATNLREKAMLHMLKNKLEIDFDSKSTQLENESTEPVEQLQSQQQLQIERVKPLWVLQRHVRAALIQQHISVQTTKTSNSVANKQLSIHPPVALGPSNFLSELLPYRNFYRTKKHGKREVKAWEKDERRRRLELEDRRRRRMNEFHKMLVAHRDEFIRFHKGKRSDCSKTARLAKVYVDNADAKKDRDEARAEMKRLQALKENDMEAYTSLVQDTKNGRLKFLLNETDSYISTINRMIQEQRVLTPDEVVIASNSEATATEVTTTGNEYMNEDEDTTNDTTAKVMMENNNNTSGSKNKLLTDTTNDYMRSAHRTVESVSQPKMLRGTLKEYQLSGLQWLVSLYNNNLNGILADEMGLGKTIQTISLLTYLMEFKNNNGPFLVVVPLSTLSNWVNEFNKWAPEVLKVVYKGAPDERKRIFREEVEAGQLNTLITTYEYIMKDKSQLRKLPWQYIIVDEGHRMKNAQSKFAQILGTAYQSKHRILLTGTPLQNDLPELWALLNFLLPTIFSSVDTFDQWFNKPFAAFRNPAPGANDDGLNTENAALSQEERLLIVHRLHEVLRPFVLRRVKSQVLDQLPDKVEKVLRCNLSGWQRKMYQSIVHKGLGRSASGGPTGGLNNTIMQLRKVCNHPYLFIRDYNIDEYLVRASGKFALLDRMLPKLQKTGHRVLMFSQMVESMNFIEQFFQLRGFPFLRLDGNTSADDREKRVFQFNEPDSPYFIFLLSTRAGGLGINLATADTVIIFDSDWNPMMDAQAQDRAHRIGQKKEVRVFRLLTNSPVEERILARATDKRNLNGLVVEAGRFTNRNTNAATNNSAATLSAQQENKEMMESLLREWSTGAATMSGGGEDGDGSSAVGSNGSNAGGGDEADQQQAEDDQINEMMAGSDAELQVYQAMDVEYRQRRLENWKALHRYHNNNNGNNTLSSNKKKEKEVAIPPLPPRLMAADELPLWMTEDCWPSKYSIIMKDMMDTSTVASGSRQGLTVKSIKDGKKGRKKKSISSAFSGTTAELEEGEEFENCDDEDEEDDENNEDNNDNPNNISECDAYVVAGKVMRKRKEGGVQYDDGMTEQQFSKFIEKQQDAVEEGGTMTISVKTKRTGKGGKNNSATADVTIYKELAKVVSDIQKIKRDDDTTFLAELFLDKPSKIYYPDYYQLIQQPIALKQIINKLRKAEYNYFEEVELDFALMSHNARTYNLDTSTIFLDSETIRSEFYSRSTPLLVKYGLIPQNNTNSNNNNRNVSQAAASSSLSYDMPMLPPTDYHIFPKKQYSIQLSKITNTNSNNELDDEQQQQEQEEHRYDIGKSNGSSNNITYNVTYEDDIASEERQQPALNKKRSLTNLTDSKNVLSNSNNNNKTPVGKNAKKQRIMATGDVSSTSLSLNIKKRKSDVFDNDQLSYNNNSSDRLFLSLPASHSKH